MPLSGRDNTLLLSCCWRQSPGAPQPPSAAAMGTGPCAIGRGGSMRCCASRATSSSGTSTSTDRHLVAVNHAPRPQQGVTRSGSTQQASASRARPRPQQQPAVPQGAPAPAAGASTAAAARPGTRQPAIPREAPAPAAASPGTRQQATATHPGTQQQASSSHARSQQQQAVPHGLPTPAAGSQATAAQRGSQQQATSSHARPQQQQAVPHSAAAPDAAGQAAAAHPGTQQQQASSSHAQPQQQHVPHVSPHNSAAAARVEEFLAKLNDEQRRAVYCDRPAARVKAGPGSGKTRVVTARVAHLLHHRRVPPDSLLVITFTNKAADELKARLAHVLDGVQQQHGQQRWGSGIGAVSAGTFHSICCRILRAYVDRLPGNVHLDANFNVFDTDDSTKAMRKVVKAGLNGAGEAKQEAEIAGNLVDLYSKIRSKFPTVHGLKWWEDDELSLDRYKAGISPFSLDELPKVFNAYTQICRESQGIDFDDLLSLTVALLQQVPAVRHELQRRWRHVLVDEFQDTNAAQYELVKLLRGSDPSAHTTFVVGDSDQAIYSWRGANPENMDVDFETSFPGCATHQLSYNYRSGNSIVDASEAVLSHDGLPRMHQKAQAMKTTPGHVEYVTVGNERGEPYWVVDKIRDLHINEGSQYQDMAIVYRLNSQSRLFEEALLKAAIPFRVLGDRPFWSRSEIKTMTCYLRLTANPGTDTMALEEVINKPARKLGAVTLGKLHALATELGTSLANLLLGDIARGDVPPLSPAQLEPLLEEVERTGALPASLPGMLPDMVAQLTAQHKQLKIRSKDVVAGVAQLRAVIYLARSTAMHRSVAATVNVLQLASGFLADIVEDGSTNKVESLRVLLSVARDRTAWLSREEDLRRTERGPAANGSAAGVVTAVEVVEGVVLEEGAGSGAAGQQPNSSGGELGDLPLFLQHVALMREMDELKDKENEGKRVSLMTLHSAKGLEFPNVFFVGFEDGLVPHIRKKDEQFFLPHERARQLEEEKRLAYVGCTRAMDRLFLIRAKERAMYGGGQNNRVETTASRYLALLERRGLVRTRRSRP